MITDLLPTLARLYFLGMLPDSVHLSHLMEAILLGLGLRHRKVDPLARELTIDPEQLLAMFNKVIRKIGGCLQQIHDATKKAKQQQHKALPSTAQQADGERAEGDGGAKKKKKKRPRPSEEGAEEAKEEAAAGASAEVAEEGGAGEEGERKKKKKKKKRQEGENGGAESEHAVGNGVEGKGKKQKYKNLS